MSDMTDRLRKLDRLFAEKVLGGKVVGDSVTGEPLLEYPNQPDGLMVRMGKPLPTYTRSLDAAWEGVEKLQTDGLNLVTLVSDSEWREGQTHYAVIHSDDEPRSDWTYCAHPSEALVIACLRAVGCMEEELT